MFIFIDPIDQVNPVSPVGDLEIIGAVDSISGFDTLDIEEDRLQVAIDLPGPKPNLKIAITVEIGYLHGHTGTDGVDHQEAGDSDGEEGNIIEKELKMISFTGILMIFRIGSSELTKATTTAKRKACASCAGEYRRFQ